MTDDPREFRRFNANFSLSLKSESGELEETKAQLVDISFTGLCLELKEPLPIGKIITIEVERSRNIPVQMSLGTGKVTRMPPSQETSSVPLKAGIQFTDPNKPSIQRLLQIIQRLRLVDSRRR